MLSGSSHYDCIVVGPKDEDQRVLWPYEPSL